MQRVSLGRLSRSICFRMSSTIGESREQLYPYQPPKWAAGILGCPSTRLHVSLTRPRGYQSMVHLLLDLHLSWHSCPLRSIDGSYLVCPTSLRCALNEMTSLELLWVETRLSSYMCSGTCCTTSVTFIEVCLICMIMDASQMICIPMYMCPICTLQCKMPYCQYTQYLSMIIPCHLCLFYFSFRTKTVDIIVCFFIESQIQFPVHCADHCMQICLLCFRCVSLSFCWLMPWVRSVTVWLLSVGSSPTIAVLQL